ncbi:hypothetical protein ACIQVE_27515 [Pseudomonas sp. NPDC098747]|uniref:hypothetical protein n=1 Tax=Pseudomonas sp. NPDC098747 TaxID=3364487 RepID=UPI00383A4DE1
MPARRAAPRYLSEQQLKNPLLRAAHQRLGNLVSLRGQYLRRLDTVNGDRRTRLEKFVAIERIAEQMLVRLDLATGVLGFIDADNGRFVLNTQRGIAEDSGVSEAVLSRLFATLDSAGYIYRRIERIRLDEVDNNGLHLVRTRVLVRFTKLFWADLGLSYVYERVQNAARKRRESELREIGQRKLADMERHSLELQRRELSRQRWQAKERRIAAPAPVEPSPQQRSEPPAAVVKKASGNDVLAALNRLMANKPGR